MKMSKIGKVCLAAAMFMSVAGIASGAIGLGTKFGGIVLEKIQPGGVYNIRTLKNLPLIVMNSGDAEVEAVVDITQPKGGELKDGYEAIADPGWIRVIPNRFTLQPGEKVSCDVIVAIPEDNSIVGKHYQAKIWSHTGGEDAFGAGVVNRIYFSVGIPGPETVQKAKKKKLLVSFDFDVNPESVYLTVPAGKKTNTEKELGKTITLTNRGAGKVTMKLESVANELKMPVPEGYEFTGDTGMLTFPKKKVKVRKKRVMDSSMILDIPDELSGKRLMFLVKSYPVKPEIPLEFYTRVYVTVR